MMNAKIRNVMEHNLTKLGKLIVLLLSALTCNEVLAQSGIKLNLVSGPGRDRGEGPAMVCDGNYDTKWCVDNPQQMPYTLILDAGQETDFAEYGLVTGDDTSMYPERNPVTWRVLGSNDKQEWTLVDDQKNNRSMGDENQQEYRFKPSFKGKYRYYRFEFTHMAGGTRIQLSEINLHKTARMPIKLTFVSGSGPATKEGPAMVCDGLLYTKWCLDEPRQMPYQVILDAGTPSAVAEYGLVTGDDTHSYPDRNPITWRLAGSNDKQTWTPLDQQKYNRRLRDENEQEYRFKPAASGSFRYYRFEFLRLTDGTRLQLSEIKLYK